MTDLVRHNINFLEYGLWFPAVRHETKQMAFQWVDREGFRYKTLEKPPSKTDAVFLLWMLKQAQENNWDRCVTFSKNEILQGCGFAKGGSDKYRRIEESLERWKSVDIEFEGTFYDVGEYKYLRFGVIESYGIRSKEEGGGVEVLFNDHWLKKIKESGYCKYLDFIFVRSLRSPVAVRLYEILSKSFLGPKGSQKSCFSIDAVKLAQKIPLSEKYPAHIIKKIRPAVKQLNKAADDLPKENAFKVKLVVERKKGRGGHALLKFYKTKKTMEEMQYEEKTVPSEAVTKNRQMEMPAEWLAENKLEWLMEYKEKFDCSE
jgi:hypothetical protein